MILKNNLKIINKDFRNYYRNVTKNDKKIRLHEYDNDRIIQLFTKKVAKNILYFYNKYIDEFKWNWRIDLMMRLYIPQKVLGVYTKITSLLCYRKFYKK